MGLWLGSSFVRVLVGVLVGGDVSVPNRRQAASADLNAAVAVAIYMHLICKASLAHPA